MGLYNDNANMAAGITQVPKKTASGENPLTKKSNINPFKINGINNRFTLVD